MATLYKERMKGGNNPNWRGGNYSRSCPYCGRSFEVVHSAKDKREYCSRRCAILAIAPKLAEARAHWLSNPLGLCPKCHEPVFRNPVYIKEQVYHTGCSVEHPPMRKRRKPNRCLICGIEIDNRKYCASCSPRGKSQITSICRICNKPFTHWKGAKRKYCSRICADKGRYGEGNGRWKGGLLSLSQRIRKCEKNRQLIKAILKRDKYTCQLCGQVGGALAVNHIKPFSQIIEEFLRKYNVLSLEAFTYELSLIALKYKPLWDKKNLRTLCKKCNWQRQVERNTKSGRPNERFE